MKTALRDLWPLVVLWAGLMAFSLALRTYVPIDETRYVTVAWEMWLRGDFLVPHLNGAPYAHKPPLLFWLYDLGWWLFGVNDWWPRLVAPSFGLASLFLTHALALQLWPQQPRRAALAAWLLFGSLFWTGYTTAAMFDMLVTAFTLLGLLGLWQAGQGRRSGWLWLALATGLGILAKGPVILLHLLPAALLAPLWSPQAAAARGRWLLLLLGAVLAGGALALAWAVPAALLGGASYAHDILWGQTAHRVVDSFAHRRPLWWYLPLLPLIFYPWFWWPPAWRGLGALAPRSERPLRFLLAWLLPSFIALSFISGKQVHYLLPLFPAVALLLAAGLERLPHGPFESRVPAPNARPVSSLQALSFRLHGPALPLALAGLALLSLPHWPRPLPWAEGLAAIWGLLPLAAAALLSWLRPRDRNEAVRWLTLSSVLLVITALLALRQPLQQAYDLRPMARQLARLQQAGVPLAHESKYAGEYHFLGRLTRPLPVYYTGQLPRWARHHPNGYIIYYFSGRSRQQPHCPRCFVQRYRGDWVALVPAPYYLEHQVLRP